jgi:hypothetical protein
MTKPHDGKYTKYVPISAADIVSDLKPQNYILQDILIQGYAYFLTARNNHGKTTLAMRIAAAITKGEDFGNLKTLEGNVLFLSGENTHDTAYKIKALAEKGLIDPTKVDVIPNAFNMVDEVQHLLFIMSKNPKSYRLVIIDSLQAYAIGSDQNTNKEAMDNAVASMRLKELKGNPTILILAHPTKNATEDMLLPYGGGAAVNALDGNLTLWLEDGVGTLAHGKLRQNTFQPVKLELEIVELTSIEKNNFGAAASSTVFNVMETDKASAKDAENYHRRQGILSQLLTCEMPAHKLAEVLIGNTDPKSIRTIERDVAHWRKKEYITPAGTPKITQAGKRYIKES